MGESPSVSKRGYAVTNSQEGVETVWEVPKAKAKVKTQSSAQTEHLNSLKHLIVGM